MTIKTRVIIFFALFVSVFTFAPELYAQSAKGLRTVVIDPGHGGKDPGALGLYKASSGYHEKDIVLSVSLLLGQKIEAAYPDVKVMYTRKTDVFIPRNDRAKMANQYADLFISIHCNGNENLSANGTSVHILGPKSKKKGNDQDYFATNQSVANRRNNLIEVEGTEVKQTKIDENETTDQISSAIMWNAIYESSLLFAMEVIDKLIKAPLRPRDIVLDQEVVDVLAYTSRPAVLLELGFVTNAREYGYLKTPEAQEEIAERIFQAFKSYKPQYDAYFDIDFGLSDTDSASVDQEQLSEEPVVTKEPVSEEESATILSENDDLYYGIQIMAGGRELKSNDPAFKGHDAHYVKSGNIYRYIIGKHSSVEAARQQLGTVRKAFPDSYVVKVSDGVVSRP